MCREADEKLQGEYEKQLVQVLTKAVLRQSASEPTPKEKNIFTPSAQAELFIYFSRRRRRTCTNPARCRSSQHREHSSFAISKGAGADAIHPQMARWLTVLYDFTLV